jgi:hypothetical protein
MQRTMPELPAKTRRTALEALSRDALNKLTERFNLTVGDRRSTAAHVEALIQSRSVDFTAVLRELGRDDLKAICAALEVDTGGREKELLVSRILGHAPAAKPTNGSGKDGAQGPLVESPAPEGKLPLDHATSGETPKASDTTLAAFIWKNADDLWGDFKHTDFGKIILPFTLLRRLNSLH